MYSDKIRLAGAGWRHLAGGLLIGAILAAIFFLFTGHNDAGNNSPFFSHGESAYAKNLAKSQRLTEEGRLEEASALLQEMLRDSPARPEAYNNLAAILALQGNLESSRDALEKALATSSTYATIYQNLGVLYAELARDSYGKALRLSAAPPTSELHLEFLAGGATQTGPPESVPKPQRESAGPNVAISSTPETGAPATSSETEAFPAPTVEQPVPEPTPAATQSRPSIPVTASAPDAVIEDEVRQSLLAWARAWSSQDVSAYLSNYSQSFKPEAGLSRSDWEELRQSRVRSPRWIEIGLSEFQFLSTEPRLVRVKVMQDYQANHYRGRTTKEFVMVRENGKWRISSEISL